MTDEQLHVRMINKRIIIVAILLLLLSGGLFYYWYKHASDITTYEQQKAREVTLQQQVNQLEEANNALRGTIEQTGKELVSFSEDKIKYINLASKLSDENDVQINKLTVSDVWDEGQMSGMTTTIEVEGPLDNVRNFVNSYCGINYTNRINVVSCRPVGVYPWFSRGIDDNRALTWLNLDEEQTKYDTLQREERAQLSQAAMEAGIPSALPDSIIQEQDEEERPITLSKMFEEKTFKVYLVIDFLGRQ